jgi:CRISPR-associated protein Csb2
LDVIVACDAMASTAPIQSYVPDNTADLCVPGWKRGEANASPKRTEKVVRSVHLDGDFVHYLFRLPEDGCPDFETIRTASRSITHLGWGIDIVVADAQLVSTEDAKNLDGVRWTLSQTGRLCLRVPTVGTLEDLMRRHSDSLNRLSAEGFRPVPPLRRFEVRRYRKLEDIENKPYVAFQILKPDASGNRAFHTPTRTRDVAAWIRHAVADVCRDWADIATFVHGHGSDSKPNRQKNSNYRFQYLPLPTINSALNRVESIRRVMVVAPVGCQEQIDFIRRRLLGHELIWQGEVVGVLNLLTGKDFVRDRYLGKSAEWCTVTPVILDGFDDHNPLKTEKLLRKALLNAGIVENLDFDDIDMDWQPFGFLAGVDPAKLFVRPDKLNGTMLHVRLRFPNPRIGPIAIGAGRYRGFGLMVQSENL